MHTGNDLHQRGLAGAVFTDEAMDLARPQGEIDRAQGSHTAEGLGNPGKFQQSGSIAG